MALPPSMTGGARLYLVSPPRVEPAAFAPMLEQALDAGPVAALQIRLKSDDDALWSRAAELWLPRARARGVAVLMADHVDLAVRCGCDGVHLTKGAALSAARAALGPEAVIGVVCEDDLAAASAAVLGSADYVAFGSLTGAQEQVPPTPARPETIRAWSRTGAVPSLAIGRIRPDGCRALIDVGAAYLAAIGAVWDDPDGPGAGVRAMTRAIERAVELKGTDGDDG